MLRFCRGKWIVFMLWGVMALTLASCGSESVQDTVSDGLGIDVSNGEEVSASDTHGGFHGDGDTCIILSFDDEQVLSQITENSDWQAFPLDETMQTLVYGTVERGEDWVNVAGPYLTDENGDTLVPEIENGYYILIDRYNGSDAADTNLLERAAFNFTVGIYDTDTNKLYYLEMDT